MKKVQNALSRYVRRQGVLCKKGNRQPIAGPGQEAPVQEMKRVMPDDAVRATPQPGAQPGAQTGAHSGFQPGGLTLRQANYALAVFLAAYILSFVDRQILGLLVDPIRRDLGLSDLQIGLLQGAAFALLYATMGVPFGMSVDRWSRRNLMMGGVIVWSIATGLCGLAGSFAALFAARVLVGVGEATLSPAVHSFLSDAYPPHKLARAMAVYTLGITLGGGMALIIGGWAVALIAQSGEVSLPLLGVLQPWQTTFVAVGAPGILIVLLLAFIREPARTHGRSATAGVPAGAPAEVPGLGAVLANFWQNRRAFIAIHLSSALFGIYGNGITGWYPTLLIRSHGLTPGEAGLWLGLVYLVCGSLGSLAGGFLSERLALAGRADANLRVVMLAALGVIVPATLAPLMPGPVLVLAVFAPACFLFYAYFACATAAIQLASPPAMRGTNAALFLLTNALVGLSVGMVAVPLADRWVFGGTGELGHALALIAAVGSTGALFAARYGLDAYGKLVARA